MKKGKDAMTATAMPGTGRRHRAVAIGSGFGRLTATKALKLAETDITDALTFLTRIAARGTTHVHHQTALWLPVIPTTLAVFATVGVLIALCAGSFSCHGRLRPHRIGKGWR
jgi:hypothetical protein